MIYEDFIIDHTGHLWPVTWQNHESNVLKIRDNYPELKKLVTGIHYGEICKVLNFISVHSSASVFVGQMTPEGYPKVHLDAIMREYALGHISDEGMINLFQSEYAYSQRSKERSGSWEEKYYGSRD